MNALRTPGLVLRPLIVLACLMILGAACAPASPPPAATKPAATVPPTPSTAVSPAAASPATSTSPVAAGSPAAAPSPAASASPAVAASPSPAARTGSPRVVASTSWAGAFARAAGATNVTLIAPTNVQHPPDYDPRPSDLAAVAGADFVLLAGFDGFAQRMRDATGGSAQVVQVNLENTPGVIRAEVTKLGDLFGTRPAADAYLTRFDAEYARISGDVKTKLGTNRPTVASHLFMAYWAEFAGLQVVGTFGPMPLQASQLAELAAKKPGVVFENAHIPVAGRTIVDATGAKEVRIINFPGDNLELLDVFAENARRIVAGISP